MELTSVEIDSVVSMHYSLTLDSGDAVDSSQGREPLQYLHGHGNIVPGLEEKLTGRKVGDKFSVKVPPETGYGEHNPDGVRQLPRSTFPQDMELQVGMVLAAEDDEGHPHQLNVVAVGDDEVTVDLNHPLAGQNLNFEIEVVAVRAATQEELTHGHVHGPGGHEH